MQSGFKLSINGDKQAFSNLAQVFEALDKRYGELEDPYEGLLEWVVEDYSNGFDAYPIRFAHESMYAGLWYAYAEDANAFELWLKAFGWGTV